MKSKNKEKRPLPVVSENERVSQLAKLRELLNRETGQPGMGESAPAMLRMLDAGQITCEYIRRQSRTKMVFASSVSPQEIEALAPLVKHPMCYIEFRFFSERLAYFDAFRGDELELKVDSNELRAATRLPQPVGKLWRSGVPDPPLIWQGLDRICAEQPVAEALDVSPECAPDGWAELSVGDQSVGVHPVETPDAPLAFPNPEAFIKDIVVLTYDYCVKKPPKLIGWANKELFLKNHRRIERDGIVQCVLDQDHLFPFDSLIKLAREKSLSKVQ
jgi:hypothetical protein